MNIETNAIVLDQFNEPLAALKTSAKNGEKVELFYDKTIDGHPVNTIHRKISRSQKNFKEILDLGITKSAIKYIHNDITYYELFDC